MIEQTTIQEESAKLRKDAKETSRLAALRAAPRAGSQRMKVLAYLVKVGGRGATDDQISNALAMSPNSVRPRRLELVEGHWVIDSGYVRPSFYGNDAIVWVATEKARDL